MLTRVRVAGLAALPLVALAVLAPPAAAAAPVSTAGPEATLLAGTSAAESLVAEPAGAADGAARSATRASFRVSYHGFPAAAQASFQRAVDTWAGEVSSSVPITIDATWRPLGAGVLGSTGARLVRDFAGAPRAGTWYQKALANKRAGRQLSAGADIVTSFNSSFNNWNFAPTPAAKGRYDFQSVVLHELGHGLGFAGAGQVSGNRGSVQFRGFPFAYDHDTENSSGKALLSYPNGSSTLKAQLTGGRLVFDSPQVRAAGGGSPARLFAPGRWIPGSSYSHLDEATYRAGNANSLMTPFIGDGETIRSPGPIVRAIFASEGW